MISKVARHLLYRAITYKREILKTIGAVYPTTVSINIDGMTFQMAGDRTKERGLGKDYLQTGCHEPDVSRAVIEILSEHNNAVVWDIGAAYGYYSRLATEFTDAENVHCFEVRDQALKLIDANNQQYADSQWTVVVGAVGDGDDEISLDEHYAVHGCPDIIKIDVEGHEEHVLSSMESMMKECSPHLFVEVHRNVNYSERRKRLQAFFDKFDSTLFICRQHRHESSQWEQLPEGGRLPAEADLRDEWNDYMIWAKPTGQTPNQ